MVERGSSKRATLPIKSRDLRVPVFLSVCANRNSTVSFFDVGVRFSRTGNGGLHPLNPTTKWSIFWSPEHGFQKDEKILPRLENVDFTSPEKPPFWAGKINASAIEI